MSARICVDLTGRCAALMLALIAGLRATAYDFISDFTGPFPIAWNPGPVAIQIKMPDTGPLIDGTTLPTSILAAINEWNGVLGQIQLTASILPASNNTNGNGINEVVLTNTINGTAFAPNVLAVALTRVTGTTRAEGDVLFNSVWIWDSYRGPRAANPERFDVRRVALHELGHVLGLDHPDEASPAQDVAAIMNSRISNTLDVLQPDDIAGAQALYGAPGFVPANNNFASAAVVTENLPAALGGTNVGSNKEAGEPSHAGNAGGRSVWWRWTAPGTGSAAITTTGSLFDTLLAVYTGNSVNALTQIAANNDAQSTAVRTSAVTFSTTAGTTYHIAVDGVAGDAGPITLNIAFASASTAPPIIRRQPSSLFVSPGGNVTLTVDSTGGSSFQWLFNGNPIASATGTSLTLNAADAARAGNYQVQITNSGGTTLSTAATLTVLNTALPNQTVTLGRNVSFTVPNSNNSVQWQFSGDGASWTNITNDSTFSGATSSQLTLSNATNSHHNLRIRYLLTGLGNIGTSTSPSATLSVAPLLLPFAAGIISDGAGGFLVTDNAEDAVLQVNSSGLVTVFAGARGSPGAIDGAATAARFNDPTGIARDPSSGTVFVIDAASHTIRQITSSGAVSTLAGSAGNAGSQDGTAASARFNGPTGIARAADGTLYLADTQNHTIRRISPAGTVTTFAGSAGVAGDQDGGGNAARFREPRGVVIDGAGNVFVADSGNNLIRRITPTGEVSTLAGISGRSGTFDSTNGTGALFNQPTGITFGPDGNLYVTDVPTCFIRRVSPSSGAVTTVAGLTRSTSLKDGSGRDAWFNQPRALTSTGDALVIADTGNAALRRMSMEYSVATLPLSGTSSTPTPPPSPTPTPTPPPSSGGGGGGGGSPSWIFSLAVLLLTAARFARSRRLRKSA
jgi:hypothetical protein